MNGKFFDCRTSGRYVGERDCQHSPAYVPFTLEGGIDTTLEIIAAGWKYIPGTREHLAWPKTTKYEELAIIPCEFIDLKKYLMVSNPDRDRSRWCVSCRRYLN